MWAPWQLATRAHPSPHREMLQSLELTLAFLCKGGGGGSSSSHFRDEGDGSKQKSQNDSLPITVRNPRIIGVNVTRIYT